MNTVSKLHALPAANPARGPAMPPAGSCKRMRSGWLWLCVLVSGVASAHAFPQKSQPPVGATVAAAPHSVKIWFDDEIRPGVSTLRVQNAAHRRVSTGPAKVENGNLLEVPLPPLPAGTYHVYWSVVSKDGHHTQGDFEFTVATPARHKSSA